MKITLFASLILLLFIACNDKPNPSTEESAGGFKTIEDTTGISYSIEDLTRLPKPSAVVDSLKLPPQTWYGYLNGDTLYVKLFCCRH